MKTSLIPSATSLRHRFKGIVLLNFSVKLWFVLATIGQWIFAYYIASFYGKSSLAGDFEKWNKVLPHGYVRGDGLGNTFVAAHVFFALIMVLGGPIQLIPQIRTRFRMFHRVLGRFYIFTAILIGIDGLVMVWTRGAVGGLLQHIAISVQALYIIAFAMLALRYALQRNFALHRQWAIRLYLVANGVWFFRVSLMAWLLLNGGPAGFDPKTFDGPFLWFLSVFTYALPISLIVFEMYLKAQQKTTRPLFRVLTIVVILVLTTLMTIGIFGATMGMWLPRI
ncbi:DUF2306 domain-containing protein [Runella sp. MFBS21]|uniref:DUF2306 domain-containing protein n=1 Tax=Runella sp. MFBS21 TaxID=3034018 RepID=UPI0023F8F130|nr:DUF2306 domain-containing protein [Runella sp. MFBS21]MDF7817174.1 DUF2306 domain-containing protein [Runella sp. MFBS21]